MARVRVDGGSKILYPCPCPCSRTRNSWYSLSQSHVGRKWAGDMSSVQSEAQDVENRVGDVRTVHTEAGRNQKRADGVQTAPSADGPNTVTGGAQTHVIRIHAGTCHSQSRSGSKDPWFLSTKSSHPREIDLLATANGTIFRSIYITADFKPFK